MKRTGLLVVASVAAGLSGMPLSGTLAEDFLDVEIEPSATDYIVLQDLNVRIGPGTKSKRVSGLKQGDRVRSPGWHQEWAAILAEGKPLGFAYKKYLLPVLDGALSTPVAGRAKIAGDGECAYTIRFAGKSEASAVLFQMADYETELKCVYDNQPITTTLYMFLTEGPMIPSKPNWHQIGMDLLEISLEDAYDEVFSTNAIYDHEKRTVRFDGISMEGFLGEPEQPELSAVSIREALDGAVKMALESWNAKTWKMLISQEE